MTHFTTYQLAPDHATYGADAGKFIVTGEDLEREYSGPMAEDDARTLASALNACQAVVDRWERGDLAEAARLCAAVVEDVTERNQTHDAIRDHHFARLNGYRQSAEYADYARSIGAEPSPGDLPTLIGNRWEIDREVYDEFLEMLPPLGWRGGAFYLSEFSFDDITARFSREGDKYYCEFARYPAPDRAKAVETPWGVADSVREVAPGIARYDTPSHGGYHVSPERVLTMPKPLRDFQPWAGPNWYEEDCDWAVVALAFPQFFPADHQAAALATLKSYQPELYEQLTAARVAGGRAL